MRRIRQGLGLVLSLLVTACGTGNSGGTPAGTGSFAKDPVQATSVAPAGTHSAGQTARPEVRTRYAWVRLRQDSFWIRPGERSRLWLDISSSKPVRRYEADWSITQGRLDRWRTDNYWEWNYWTAAFGVSDRCGVQRCVQSGPACELHRRAGAIDPGRGCARGAGSRRLRTLKVRPALAVGGDGRGAVDSGDPAGAGRS